MTTTTTAPRSQTRFTQKIWQRMNPEQTPYARYFLEVGTGLAAVIIGFIILFSYGIIASSQQNSTMGIAYRQIAGIAVAIITLGLVIWPIIRSWRQKEWWRMGVLIALVPLLGFAVPLGMQMTAGLFKKAAQAGMYEGIIAVFAFLLGCLALALNVWLVFRIGATSSRNPEVKQLEKAVQDAEQLAEMIEMDARNVAGKRDQASADFEAAKKAHEKAHAKAEKASRQFTKADKDHKDSPENEAEKEAANFLQSVQAAHDSLIKDIKAAAEDIRAATSDEDKETLAQSQADAEINLEASRSTVAQAERLLQAAQIKSSTSETGKAYEKAKENNSAASKAEAHALKTRRKLKNLLKAAEAEFTQVGKRKEAQMDAVNTARAELNTTLAGTDKNTGKYVWSFVFLFVSTVICYTFGWYGWVLSMVYPSLNL